MHNFFRKLVGTGVVCGMLVFAAPLTSMAAIGPGFAAGTYVATVTAESVNINKNRDSEEVLFTVKAGSTYEVLEDCGDGWMKVRVHDTECSGGRGRGRRDRHDPERGQGVIRFL